MTLGAQDVPWTLPFSTSSPVLGVSVTGHRAHNLTHLLLHTGLCRGPHSDLLPCRYLTRAIGHGLQGTGAKWRSLRYWCQVVMTIREALGAGLKATSQSSPDVWSTGRSGAGALGRGRAARGGGLAATPPEPLASARKAAQHVLPLNGFHQMSWGGGCC